jgi:hypothetical protein
MLNTFIDLFYCGLCNMLTDLWFITSQPCQLEHVRIVQVKQNIYLNVYTIWFPTEYYLHILRGIARVGRIVRLTQAAESKGS